jgi:4-amino-4-deoxy-L-arabinose transferase-like glycosyltransferase
MLLVTSAGNARYCQALSLLGVGALIKSPVAFVFLAFYVTWLLVNRTSTLSSRRSWLRLGGLLATSLSAALSADAIRRAVSKEATR